MPELPEVETLRGQLQRRLVGARVRDVIFAGGKPSPLANVGEEDFRSRLRGRAVERVERRGKFLDLHLSGGLHWLLHLRMTGRLLLREPGEPPDPYTRFVATLDDGRGLVFADVRKFGRAWLTEDPGEVLGRLGPEPESEEFSVGYLRSRLERRRGPVKAALLDQTLVAGVGNIYADEGLFHAGIHPLRPAGELDDEELRRLHGGVLKALAQGVDLRGASFRDFVDVDGARGEFQDGTQVVGRSGEPCHRCGATIQKARVAGRGTHFCPRCQPGHPAQRSRQAAAAAAPRREPVRAGEA